MCCETFYYFMAAAWLQTCILNVISKVATFMTLVTDWGLINS